MKTLADLKEGKAWIKMMCIGGSGTGKTYLSGTFPKTYFLSIEPGGMDTIIYHPELKNNLVGWVELVPENPQDTKRTFQLLDSSVTEAKELAKEGKVETLVVDNFTFLTENRWIYIEEFETELTNSGAVNKLAMFGKLARWCYQFTLMQLLTFPGNVILNCHEALESDEVLDKKPDKTCPVLPNILGGFRDKVEGMFSLVFYLNKIRDEQKKNYRYFVRTNKGNQRNAKSRVELPEIVEDVSYQKITEAIQKNINQSKKEVVV